MCPHEEKLTAWLLGDLPPGEHESLTRHLDGCAACRAVRDELSRVLTPLRSALAKDSLWRDAAGTAAPCRPHHGTPLPSAPPTVGTAAPCRPPLWAWLWLRPHDGLKRAALLAVSFGTLFALISAVYRSANRERVPAGDITHIEFHKASDEAPAPALAPMPQADKADDASTDRLAAEAKRSVATFSVASKPVPHPAPPAPEPRMPELRRLVNAEAPKAAPAEAAARSDAASGGPASVPAAPAAKAAAVAKRERAKPSAVTATRPPANLQAKPLLLAGATLAPTNSAATNAIPTNAVPPTAAKRKP
jgi:hypothetical protein